MYPATWFSTKSVLSRTWEYMRLTSQFPIRIRVPKGSLFDLNWQIAQNKSRICFVQGNEILLMLCSSSAIWGHGSPQKPAMSQDGDWRAVALRRNHPVRAFRESVCRNIQRVIFCAICQPTA